MASSACRDLDRRHGRAAVHRRLAGRRRRRAPPAGGGSPVTKSQIYFLDPNGMQIGWQTGAGPNGERTYLPAQLTVPARYNFNQGYHLPAEDHQHSRAGRRRRSIPTIEVAPTTPATDAYLAHNAIPVQFTAEDFDQVVDGGNFVTKVIYLPDPKYQELAVSGVETLVSTRLEPGVDPILEADKRGTILLIVRLGAIDLEMPGLARSRRRRSSASPIGAAAAPSVAASGHAWTARRTRPPAILAAGPPRPRGARQRDPRHPAAPAAPAPAPPTPAPGHATPGASSRCRSRAQVGRPPGSFAEPSPTVRRSRHSRQNR